jgi:chromosome segregation ATPase
MRLINAICFLLLATNSHAAFWNKKDKQNGQRRRLTESPTNVVDVDAATGTVRNVLTPAQQEAAKAAQSCDGQMAQSLVKANEEMLEARADLGDLQKENDAALHLIQDLQGSLAKAEEVEKELTAKIDQTEQIKDKKIQSLTESLKMSQEEIVTEYEGQLAKAEERHAEQVQALNAKLDNAKEDYLADIRAMEAKDLAATEDVERSLQIALEGAQQKHNGEVESLKQQLETQAQEAEATLHTYKDEAKAFMLAQVEAREDKIEAAKGQANNAENALKGQHEVCQGITFCFLQFKLHRPLTHPICTCSL